MFPTRVYVLHSDAGNVTVNEWCHPKLPLGSGVSVGRLEHLAHAAHTPLEAKRTSDFKTLVLTETSYIDKGAGDPNHRKSQASCSWMEQI